MYEIRGNISSHSKKIKQYNITLDEMNAEFKSRRENKDKFSEELDNLEAKVQDIKKEIGDLFEEKNNHREEHYKGYFNYEAQLEEIAYYKE